jgi:hypothetical protein
MIFPQTLENSIRVISKFFEISRRYSQVKVHLQYQRHPAANFATCTACAVDTSGKFATDINNTGGKFAAGVNHAGGKLPPVSMTPAANLPPVSNNGNSIRLLKP